jgi:hypothetical protein
MPATTKKQAWPADVLEFARASKVEGYLDPLLQATRVLFPTGVIRVYLHHDPELSGVTFIVYHTRVPLQDVPDFKEANCNWSDSLLRIVPLHLGVVFAQLLERVK